MNRILTQLQTPFLGEGYRKNRKERRKEERKKGKQERKKRKKGRQEERKEERRRKRMRERNNSQPDSKKIPFSERTRKEEKWHEFAPFLKSSLL